MKEEGRLERTDEGCSQGPDQEEPPGLGNFTLKVRAYQEIPQLGESIAPSEAGLLADLGGNKKKIGKEGETKRKSNILRWLRNLINLTIKMFLF